MEHLVLKVLGFDLSGPTANVFLSQMCQMSNSAEKVQHLAMYLCELSLLHGDTFLSFPPSEVAAASLVLARHALARDPRHADRLHLRLPARLRGGAARRLARRRGQSAAGHQGEVQIIQVSPRVRAPSSNAPPLTRIKLNDSKFLA